MAKLNIYKVLSLGYDGRPFCPKNDAPTIEAGVELQIQHMRAMQRREVNVNQIAEYLLQNGKVCPQRLRGMLEKHSHKNGSYCCDAAKDARPPFWSVDDKGPMAWFVAKGLAEVPREAKDLCWYPFEKAVEAMEMAATRRQQSNTRGVNKTKLLTRGDCVHAAMSLERQRRDELAQQQKVLGLGLGTEAGSPKEDKKEFTTGNSVHVGLPDTSSQIGTDQDQCSQASLAGTKRCARDISPAPSTQGSVIVIDSPRSPAPTTPVSKRQRTAQNRSDFVIPKTSLQLLQSESERINDDVINTGLAILAERATRPFKVVSSLNQKPHNGVAITTEDWIFAALHLTPNEDFETHHWVLVVIPPVRRQVWIYDPSPSAEHRSEARSKLNKVYENLCIDTEPLATWTSPVIQLDGVSCGVIALATASYIAAEREVTADIQYAPWRSVLFHLLKPVPENEDLIRKPKTLPDILELLKATIPEMQRSTRLRSETAMKYGQYKQPTIPCIQVFRELEQTQCGNRETTRRVQRVVGYLASFEVDGEDLESLQGQLSKLENLYSIACGT